MNPGVVRRSSNVVQTDNNRDAAFEESGDGWATSTDGAPHRGDSAVHRPGRGDNTATWHFDGLVTGTRYEVLAIFVPGAERATNAAYTILDGSRVEGTLLVNQRSGVRTAVAGQAVESLGNYVVDSGSLTVELSDRADGSVSADVMVLFELPAKAPKTAGGDETESPESDALPPQSGGGMMAKLGGASGSIEGRWVFYNNSSFDGYDPGPGVGDDGAIPQPPPVSDPDHFPNIELGKEALLPGRTAQYANLTN